MSLYSHKMFISEKAVPVSGTASDQIIFELCLKVKFALTFSTAILYLYTNKKAMHSFKEHIALIIITAINRERSSWELPL